MDVVGVMAACLQICCVINLGFRAIRMPVWHDVLVHWKGAYSEVVFKFVSMFAALRDSACS